jgi:hypothetical protein
VFGKQTKGILKGRGGKNDPARKKVLSINYYEGIN